MCQKVILFVSFISFVCVGKNTKILSWYELILNIIFIFVEINTFYAVDTVEDKYEYFKRDISWLSFNFRVLLEADDDTLPLYERIKFISIYSSN